MEAKFTKGPWEVARAEFTDEGVNFEVIMPEQRICALDAKLISAAPLLYEALNGYDQIIRVVLQALERDAENGKAVRGEMAAELREKLGNACNALRAARGEK